MAFFLNIRMNLLEWWWSGLTFMGVGCGARRYQRSLKTRYESGSSVMVHFIPMALWVKKITAKSRCTETGALKVVRIPMFTKDARIKYFATVVFFIFLGCTPSIVQCFRTRDQEHSLVVCRSTSVSGSRGVP
jgi:hypothetical protein